ncbi:MAG: 3-deoxy-7-phosphoheptulonate synthase [Eggerthellales bacterium]|nr:3-deoxy-7-phosphoheptulonate synthase [Eggerthellales bacterium]
MAMTVNSKLPSPEELKSEYPLTPEMRELKDSRDREIAQVFTGDLDKFVVIVGPCSADREDAVLEYVDRLGRLNEKVSERLILIPRIYTNKPRTTGEGYKGMLHQPDPTAESDLYKGLKAIRRMHLKAMEVSGLTGADEMLYPENRSYLDDILSYEAVGARSVENQQHRLVASGADIPIGMKNPISGDLSVMINSIIAAQGPKRFLYRQRDVTTTGNPLAHAIMRGAANRYGTTIPNYHYEDLTRLNQIFESKPELRNPACIVDANHSNSGKQYHEQIRIVSEVLHSRSRNQVLHRLVKGVMVESYLEEGNQPIGECMVYGKSITDPCLGWKDTERLILEIAERA